MKIEINSLDSNSVKLDEFINEELNENKRKEELLNNKRKNIMSVNEFNNFCYLIILLFFCSH